jgi:glycosidase
MDPGRLARHTRVDKLPGVLDFAFSAAAVQAIGGPAPTSLLTRLYADDPLYDGGWAMATTNPTFLGNHDKGRFGFYVRQANPKADDAEIAARTLLGHALMLFGRGAPTIYYGDEQGFAGDGNDQDSRETLFASKVASYNDNKLIGSAATTATANFNPDHPFYKALAAMAAVRHSDAALRRGRTIVRQSGDTPGIFSFSRVIDGEPGETLVTINTATTAQAANVLVDPASQKWRQLSGNCAATSTAPGSVKVSLAPLSWSVCTTRMIEGRP